MTTEWIITTVSLCLTALMSLGSIILPFIMNYKERKIKQKIKQIDLLNCTIDKLMTGYGEYRTNTAYKLNLLSAIYSTMIYCSESTQQKLQVLCERISKQSSYQDVDAIFYECIDSLRNEFNFKKRIGK